MKCESILSVYYWVHMDITSVTTSTDEHFPISISLQHSHHPRKLSRESVSRSGNSRTQPRLYNGTENWPDFNTELFVPSVCPRNRIPPATSLQIGHLSVGEDTADLTWASMSGVYQTFSLVDNIFSLDKQLH